TDRTEDPMESTDTQTLRLVAGWAVVSAVLMAIGAFGPWVTLLGTFTARGTDDGTGWKVVGAAIVAAVALGFVLRWRRRWLCLVPALAGTLGVAITAYNLHEIWADSEILLGSRLEEAEWGIYVALVGSQPGARRARGSLATPRPFCGRDPTSQVGGDGERSLAVAGVHPRERHLRSLLPLLVLRGESGTEGFRRRPSPCRLAPGARSGRASDRSALRVLVALPRPAARGTGQS